VGKNLVRSNVVFQLRQGDAHLSFLDVVANFPSEAINVRPPNIGYSFWGVLDLVRYGSRTRSFGLPRLKRGSPTTRHCEPSWS
jgi:hypothetical protein